ncbi:MipA/OmpV family protein [Qipengyuania sp.]|uniref:MipA/OmpV family protein n=1 Tax=Qipengyuania sp. TaxID=2004515 RepID=UPI003BAD7293
MKSIVAASGLALLLSGAPALAQDVESLPTDEETVFDENWISIGLGAIYSPSYNGSDDYVFSPVPIVQGQLGTVGISPRPAGVALDFVNDDSEGATISGGISARLNRNRAVQIEDPVVLTYGELDTAFEVGPTIGISFPGVLNQFDSLSVNVDALWDVAGAHDGVIVSPSVTYFTPLSRGMAISLSVGGDYVDDDYADYYYSVPAGGPLAPFRADGGWESVGVNLLTGIDLDGDLANGGLALIVLGGYSRMLGDAKRTPFTSVRGDADQWLGALGIGYTF